MFSKLNHLEKNDVFYIYDIQGNKLEYKVFNKYIADNNDTSFLNESNSIEATLITCSNSNNSKKLIIKGIAK